MRINEIITESQELEEGWKSKLGAAALAGAAALGGGGSDVQAQNYQPTAQSQQREVSRVNAQGQPTDHVRFMQRSLGFAKPYHDAGLLSPEENKIYAKYANATSDIYKKMAPRWQKEADENYSSGFKLAKGSMRGVDSQQILQWNATNALKQVIAQDIKFGGGEGSGNFGVMLNPEAKSYYYKADSRASQQSNYAQKNMPQQNVEPKFDPTQEPFLMDMSGKIDRDIAKFKSDLDSNLTAGEKNNVIKQIDARIKYYFNDIEDVKAGRGVSSEENAYLVKKIQGLSALKAATPSKYGDTVVGQAKPLSAQDQKFYDSFNSDLNKVSQTLNQIRASKPTREKMEAARQDLARVIPQYDSTLNQAVSRGFDKSAAETFKLKIDDLKRIAGIPLNRK